MDIELLFSLGAIFVLLLVSAFFSASETGLTAVSRARIFHLVKEENKRAVLVTKLREEKELLIGTILLGNNFANTLGSALATSAAISLWGDTGVFYATAVMTVVILVFGEVLPKTFALQRSEEVALALAPPIKWLIKLFYPMTMAIKGAIRLLCKIFGIDLDAEQSFISATEILRGTIEMHHQQGEMERQDRDMLGGILELEVITVEDVMIHRKHVDALDINIDPQQLISDATALSHSRIPIYEGEFDRIIGVLHIKDLLRLIDEKTRRALVREDIVKVLSEPWFIPSTTSLKDQLYAFRQKRQHFSLVVDEYGSLLGVVTLEDIIEEIVGEIDDEYDTIDASGIAELKAGIWLADGDVGIRDLNRYLNWDLSDEDANTLAGLVIHAARDIPEAGKSFVIDNVRFTVEARTASQITKIRIELLPQATNPADGGK